MTTANAALPAGDQGLQATLAAGLKSAYADKHTLLTEQSQKWVAQTFFGAMLRQMRNSPFRSDLFSGGRGGQAFQEMQDQHLAERMAQGAGRSLAASIVRHIERRARPVETPSATRRPAHVASTR